MTDQRALSEHGVSVLMPTYNCERFVAEAIDSVLAQDYPHKELIVVDDGSTDRTVDVVRGYGERVRLLQQANAGAAAARNHAARAAGGRYISFIDGDDVWLPGKLSAQVSHIERHPEIGLVYGSWSQWFADASGTWPPAADNVGTWDDSTLDEAGSGWLYTRLLFDSVVCTITVLMPRALFDQVGGFDETLRLGEDYDLWIRLSRRTAMHKLQMPMALYRIHGASTTRTPPGVNHGYQVVARALNTWGGVGPDGSRVEAAALARRLQALSIDFAHYHLHRGDPCAARAALQLARRDGARSVKLNVYSLLAGLRCLLQRRSPATLSKVP